MINDNKKINDYEGIDLSKRSMEVVRLVGEEKPLNKLAQMTCGLALKCLKDYSHKFNDLFIDSIRNYRNKEDPLPLAKNLN